MFEKKLEKILADARTKRVWGEITITLKDGRPILIKQTSQEKVEDYPAHEQTYTRS